MAGESNTQISELMRRRELGSTRFGLTEIWRETESFRTASRGQQLRHLVVQSWRSVLAAPLTAVLTLVTIAAVLFVSGTALLLFQNTTALLQGGQSALTVRLYLHDAVTEGERATLEKEVAASPQVKQLRFINKAEALAEFGRALEGQSALLDGLQESNPLPASFEVTFHPHDRFAQTMESFATRFEHHPAVQHLQYSRTVLGEFSGLVTLVTRGGIAAITLMVAISAFVVMITIRLGLYAHRHEIRIMKLVGATDRSIVAPFLLEGAVQGLAGATIASVILFLGFRLIDSSLRATEMGIWIAQRVTFLSPVMIVLLLVLGTALGLLGSYCAVRRLSDEG